MKIFDIERYDNETDPRPLAILQGHNDLIHDISWSSDDQYLVTASADCSVKVWSMAKLNIQSQKLLNYSDNNEVFLIAILQHPSFVYGCKFHPFKDESSLNLATICYDGKVRLWKIYPDDNEHEPTAVESIHTRTVSD